MKLAAPLLAAPIIYPASPVAAAVVTPDTILPALAIYLPVSPPTRPPARPPSIPNIDPAMLSAAGSKASSFFFYFAFTNFSSFRP
jgi:hypothetical protein